MFTLIIKNIPERVLVNFNGGTVAKPTVLSVFLRSQMKACITDPQSFLRASRYNTVLL